MLEIAMGILYSGENGNMPMGIEVNMTSLKLLLEVLNDEYAWI